MKKENAGLKSIQEAISRMAAGEVFYHKDNCTFTMEQESERSRVRFMLNKGDDIKGYWDYLEQWEVEVEAHWTDDVKCGEGVLCFVTDGNTIVPGRNPVQYIIGYRQGEVYPYQSSTSSWRTAQPVSEIICPE